MTRPVSFFRTAIGRKLLMGSTGLTLIAFLIVHLAGNLLILVDQELFNLYSYQLLRHPIIYVAEFFLLAILVGHFVTGLILRGSRQRTRPVPYRQKKWQGPPSRKSIASSTMFYTGLVLLVFLPLHLITFKFGAYYASPDTPDVRDLGRLVIEVFQQPGYVIWYVSAMALTGFHLWYGFESAFESLGANYRPRLRRFGQALAVLLAGGFLIIPLILYFWGDRL